jgi:hypothetical protein
VLYELRKKTVTVQDSEIEKQLKPHASGITLKQTAIEELQNATKGYKLEHKKIQQVAAQLGIFLKKNLLSPMNDATI